MKVLRMRLERLLLPMIIAVASLSGPLLVLAVEQNDPVPAVTAGTHDGANSRDGPSDAASHGEAGTQGEKGTHGETGTQGGGPNPLAIDIDLAIWTGVVFAVLFFVLNKFAWPSISAALEERENRIASTIADAEAKHEESKRLLAEHEAKLALAADEVRGLLDEARRDAEHTKSQILAEAKALATQERDRAVRDVERAADHAMQNLAESSANLAVELAGKVVRQNITPDQQAALVREALGKLASSSPSVN